VMSRSLLKLRGGDSETFYATWDTAPAKPRR
jgi:hypothetical protein